MTVTDPVLERITRAVDAADRDDLVGMWADLGADGDPLHRCVLAHHLADMVDDAADALMWDERALSAAGDIDAESLGRSVPGVQIAALYPSLHLNIADDLRRLGSFAAAAAHLARARDALSSFAALGPDHAPYVAMMRGLVDDIDAMVQSRSTGRRTTAPG